MAKLKPEDLDTIAQQTRQRSALGEGNGRARVTVHMGTCGISAGAGKVKSALQTLIEAHKAEDVVLTVSGCAGLCSREPMITVELKDQAPVKYVDVDEDKAHRIFEEHVVGGDVVAKYALGVGSERVA